MKSMAQIVWDELEMVRSDYESRGFEIDRLHRQMEGIKQSARDYKARCRILAGFKEHFAKRYVEADGQREVLQKDLDALRQERAKERRLEAGDSALSSIREELGLVPLREGGMLTLFAVRELKAKLAAAEQAVRDRDNDLTAQDKEIEVLRERLREAGGLINNLKIEREDAAAGRGGTMPPAYRVRAVDGSNTGSLDGYEVVNAATGERVDAWLRSRHPHLSLEDCHRYAMEHADRENEAVNRGGQ